MSFAALQARVNAGVLAVLCADVAVIDGVEVVGRFDDAYAEPLGFAGSTPAFTARSADVSTVTQGTALTVNGVSYTVTSNKPDGTGMTVLGLQEA